MRFVMAYFIILLLFFLSSASANFTFDFFNNSDALKRFRCLEPFNNSDACKRFNDVTINTDSVDLTINKNGKGTTDSVGKIYYNQPFRFKNATAAASFSTVIDFNITAQIGLCPGDGMAFFAQSDPTLWAGSGWLGLNGSNVDNPFLAVEFDTYLNQYGADANVSCGSECSTSSFHVGIDLNTTVVSVNHTCYRNLTSGKQRAWIDYDAQTQLLELRITQQSYSRPSAAIVSAHVDLFTLFKNNDSLYVGLSAATGTAGELHTVSYWSFNIGELQIPLSAPAPSPPPQNNPASSPPPQNNLSVSPPPSKNTRRTLIIVFAITIPACALIACLVCCIKRAQIRNRKKRDNVPQMPEMSIPVPRYSYADLSLATKRFSKSEILGKGGYGSVYKGVLPNDGSMVAVKVMAVEGLNQFLAELSVIGRLKHKNLVGLRGWCYDHEKLILVYDYMPNGSLDQHLFSTDRLLSWSQRYEIIKGIAEGLLFLHCEWEKRIVHRDIKAANVLLDGKFSARLGDFGLSKLMEDNKTQQTMTQAGTRGYIAPELAYKGRANEKSDIYSFGVLLLEIACGKSVLGYASETQEYQFLLDWVWQAHAMDDLLGVADPRLDSEYNQEEMRVILCLGLICSHPDADRRPSMKECCQIINYGAVLPDLPISKPTVSFGDHQVLLSSIFSQSSGSKGQSSGYINSGNSDRSSVPLLHHT